MSKTRTKKTPSIGSVSTGTLRPEDLIPAFVDALADFKPRLAAKYDREFSAVVDRDFELNDPDSAETLGFICDELQTALSDVCPPYMYFGTLAGDGADFGFWPDWDSIDNDEDVLRVADLSDVPRGYSGYALVVNDHGNAALYRVANGRHWLQWDCI